MTARQFYFMTWYAGCGNVRDKGIRQEKLLWYTLIERQRNDSFDQTVEQMYI